MQRLPVLKPGDSVEIIAPASRCTDEVLSDLNDLLGSWQLNCIIDQAIFGNDLLCANTDEIRFNLLRKALLNSATKAVICARGGYGSMRLLPQLSQITPVNPPKLFVGMSDITAIHLFLEQQWQWPTIHGALARDKFSPESILSLKSILFGDVEQISLSGLPLNELAASDKVIEARLTGGNLTLVQTSIGTIWQLDGQNKIIFLEEVGERGYRVDRMLEHLSQASVFKEAAAILFGDFLTGNEPNGSSLVKPVLERFAQNSPIPVAQIEGIGHGYTNFPLLLGAVAKLQLGERVELTCFR
ncbi:MULTISPECIES: S66 peptidase family protein [unclassified Legionella]|uniref:S66 peptidase family protein n=1 Tax=unclassified Legionella TaxID=2622702 RepID=UPI001E42E4EB|nr:LD-carboxypeptidase [Legionella sp. 31fI33]MCC5016326.1 LD-carboxypeptidase [Legionella sp. 31fI33]